MSKRKGHTYEKGENMRKSEYRTRRKEMDGKGGQEVGKY